MLIPNVPRELRPFGPEETLLYYDGPLLFWLPVEGRHLLAVALFEEDDAAWPFLVSELSAETAAALKANELTLQRAVLDALAWYFLADYDAEVLDFEPVQQVPEDWLPGDVTLDP